MTADTKRESTITVLRKHGNFLFNLINRCWNNSEETKHTDIIGRCPNQNYTSPLIHTVIKHFTVIKLTRRLIYYKRIFVMNLLWQNINVAALTISMVILYVNLQFKYGMWPGATWIANRKYQLHIMVESASYIIKWRG